MKKGKEKVTTERDMKFPDYTVRGLFHRILTELLEINRLLRKLTREVNTMSSDSQAALDEMKAEVERNTTVTGSVKALIDGFIAAAGEAADDPEEIRALIATLKQNTDVLAAAVPANTPTPTEPPA